jgi:sigma-E factor negative regulatory protein RseA
MNHESLLESLSAVMDNEADELELRRVLAATDEAAVRATWSRYQLARAAMHKDVVVPRLDIASAVSAAIAEEKVPARTGSLWRGVGRLAVAASVTLAVLAGVRLYNQDSVSGVQVAQKAPEQPATLTAPQVQGPAVLAGYNTSVEAVPATAGAQAQPGWHEQHLGQYLQEHAKQSTGGAGQGDLPYARGASLDGNR